jgi:hypothetical protein
MTSPLAIIAIAKILRADNVLEISGKFFPDEFFLQFPNFWQFKVGLIFSWG